MARRRSHSSAVVLGVLVVSLLVGTMVLVSVMANRGSVEVNLGDDEAGPYDTRRLAAEIADAGPFLLPDASPDRSRDIYIQHLGRSHRTRWLAFSARAPGQRDRACSLQWEGDEFTDPCDGHRYPADGRGLTQYPTRIEDGKLYVDLGRATAD